MLAAHSGSGEPADHYRAALALEERVGSRPWTARTRYWYGRLLLDAGDADAGAAMLAAARADAAALNMAGLLAAIDVSLRGAED
ncbi:MAG: hypothetical protein M3527_04400 [Actinomycetota bacterium]|nr:hypothetical protein [Actinomycetota bacterium]